VNETGRTGRSRRSVLAGMATAGAAGLIAACSGDDDRADPALGTGPAGRDGRSADASPEPVAAPPLPGVTADPFTLGVASGDPDPTSVVLWTRLVPEPDSEAGGMPEGDAAVVWEVAADPGFAALVATGTAAAPAADAHSVHVVAGPLEPGGRYHYRFRAGEWTSPVGRTRSAPAPGEQVDRMVVGTGSCQHYESGWYVAHRALAEEADLDLVLWLGDYIYEGGPGSTGVRRHTSPEITTLADYRRRYALYKADTDLQAAHAAAPWVVTWDDHEVENNYAGLVPQDDRDLATFPERRAAAYRAWWEHQPVRLPPPDGTDLDTYRELRWGRLAGLYALDTRQDRSDQVCDVVPGLDAGPVCAELGDPTRQIMAVDEEERLTASLLSTDASWNVLANQVVFSPVPLIGEDLPAEQLAEAARSVGISNLPPLDGLRGVLADQWDGYPQQRDRVLAAIAASPAPTVVVTGDIHASAAGPVRASATDPASPVVGAEFVGTSISSDPGRNAPLLDAVFGPAFDYVQSARRGYVRLELTPTEALATYVVVDDARRQDSGTRTDAAFRFGSDRTFRRV
jgi:alkaline phosphatase D